MGQPMGGLDFAMEPLKRQRKGLEVAEYGDFANGDVFRKDVREARLWLHAVGDALNTLRRQRGHCDGCNEAIQMWCLEASQATDFAEGGVRTRGARGVERALRSVYEYERPHRSGSLESWLQCSCYEDGYCWGGSRMDASTMTSQTAARPV